MQYVNLYIETEYSMLNSTLKLEDIVSFSKENVQNQVAITDLDNMHGVIKFYRKCVEKGIKPIIGLHLTLQSDNNFYNSILLYAKDNIGYGDLLKIATIRKIKKDLFIEDIKDLLDHIIVILPSDEHELIKAYLEGNEEEVYKIYKKYESIKDLYLGLDLQTEKMRKSIDEIINFFKNKLPMVAINKASYLSKNDYDVYKILKCVDKNVKDYKGQEKEHNLKLITSEEATDLFRNYLFLVKETNNIASKCNVTINFDGYKMPTYDDSKDTNLYLHDLSIIGLKKRLSDNAIPSENYQKYIDRLLYELKIISKMGFSDYFLIVYDFIKYAKKEKILVGPGRGSAPSSLVAYSLGITELDPLQYNLLFERFLNPERISMPDIDTDFPDNERPKVINYMMKRFGKKRVAHICTFGTYGPRSAVRDIARVSDLKNNYLDEILKHIGDYQSIKDVLADDELYRRMYDEDEVIRYVTDIALKMENLPRNTSVHAAGIIMADKDLINYTPLEEGINGLYQTQYEASDLEKLGLVKIDFLGLKNLTIIDKVLKEINKNINIYKLPLNDSETYKLIASGNTNGIFQLESSGMKNTLMLLKTSSFIDIVNALALYRPGPMEMIPSFVKRKFGKEEIVYLNEDLKDILSPTYGIIVYQEQILQIANKFAGFSLGEADVLRRAVSKKNMELLSHEKNKFIKGSLELGHDVNTSEKIFDYILKFANYGFNKSHSVAYSMISYQMAFLKRHYFKEFMAVMMSDKIGSVSQIKTYILECLKENVEVLIPSINRSGKDFKVYENKIYYSLLGINGLGEVIVNQIISERNKKIFSSYDEFIERTKGFLNKKHIENLIYSGALDDFKISRKAMIDEYDQSLQLANFGDAFKTQLSTHIFGEDEYTYEEISNLERLALGFNLKFDVFRKYSQFRKKYHLETMDKFKLGGIYKCIFMFRNIKEITTKNSEKMAFGTIYDNTFELDCVAFPKPYSSISPIESNKVYFGEIKIEKRKDSLQAVIMKVVRID